MKMKLFSYDQLDTFVHKLSGLTKLLCFLLLTSTVMFTYDLRVILGVMVLSFVVLKISKIKYRQIRLMLIYVAIFLITNVILTYLFSPEEGCSIYGTRHVLVTFWGHYTITSEQILYQATKLFKYASVIPLGIIFVLTTNPSEFASSLNGIKVSYKACYAISLTLRYFPDIQRDYHNISLAQQARGLDMSHKEKALKRMKNTLSIVVPLIFSTLDRVELIGNAMDLRGFGKHKHRSWYAHKGMDKHDYLALGVCLGVFAFMIFMWVAVNHSKYWNPFV